MFKKGDRVKFVDATYARGGKPDPRLGQSEAHAKHLGKIGDVVRLTQYGDEISVRFDDGSLFTGYPFRIEHLKEEWMLAPKEHEFKVGDVVKIGELVDERANGFAEYVGISHKMYEYVGKEAVVTSTGISGRLCIDIDKGGYIWNPRWMMIRSQQGAVAPRPQFKKGDKVVVAKKAITKDGPKWIEEQDACLNEEGKIVAIDAKNKDIYQVSTASGEWWYCADALLSVKDFLKNGGKLKRDEAAIKANLDEAVEKWLVGARRSSGQACCDFAVFVLSSTTGELITHSNIGAPCHATLNLYKPVVEVIGAVDFPYFKGAVDNPDWDRYADYIINRSSFRVAFHPTNIEDVKANGVRLNVEATADQVAGGCVALRHGTEWPAHLEMFAFLLDQGIDEDTAWLGSFMVQKTNTAGEYQKARVDGGHQAMTGGMPADKVFSFFKNGWPDLEKRPYKYETKYAINAGMGYDAYLLGGAVKVSLNEFRDNNLKIIKKGDGWASKEIIDKTSVLNFCKAIQQAVQKA